MNMTHRLTYLLHTLTAVALTLLTACTADDPSLPTGTAASPRFVLAQPAQTKVTYPTDSYVQSVFEEGDVLGAFAISDSGTAAAVVEGTRSNARYVVSGQPGSAQTLEPELPQDAFPSSTDYTYIFYYPYREGTVFNNVTHLVEADQRAQTWTDSNGTPQTTYARYEQSDLLWDAATGTETNDALTVSVEMNHAMASIILEVPTDMMHKTAEPWAQILGIKSLVAGINLLTESSDNPTGNMETVLNQDIYMWRFATQEIEEKEMHVFRAAIPAQTIGNGTPMFRIQTGAGDNAYSTYNAQFTGTGTGTGITFQPGRYYRFTVTETGLRFAGLIENLEDGGDYYYEY